MENKMLTCSDPVNRCITLSYFPNLHLLYPGFYPILIVILLLVLVFLQEAWKDSWNKHLTTLCECLLLNILFRYIVMYWISGSGTLSQLRKHPCTQDVPAVERQRDGEVMNCAGCCFFVHCHFLCSWNRQEGRITQSFGKLNIYPAWVWVFLCGASQKTRSGEMDGICCHQSTISKCPN